MADLHEFGRAGAGTEQLSRSSPMPNLWRVTVLVALTLFVGASQASAARVDMASTGNNSERVSTVPIRKPDDAKPEVVMSLREANLPSLEDGDMLKATAELEVTTDCLVRVRGCQGDPYNDFDPKVNARLILASERKSTEGTELASQEITCLQRLPNREHHCVIVFDPVPHRMEHRDPRRFVNLVVAATHEHARSGSKLIIGAANAHDSKVQSDKGRVNAVRRRGDVPSMTLTSTTPGPKTVQIANGIGDSRKRLVYALKLPRALKVAGTQLDVAALVKTSHGLSHNVRIGSQVFLSKNRRSDFDGKALENEAAWSGEISEHNGSNCTPARDACVPTRKVGVMRLRETVSGPLWVNVIIVTQPLQADPPDDATVRVHDGGSLTVIGYPPQTAGSDSPSSPQPPRPLPPPPPPPLPPNPPPPRPPEAITTDPSSGGSCREKTLRGLVDPRGTETSYRFIWRRINGDTTHYAPWRSAGTGTSRIQVQEHTDALVPSRDYEAKLVAENAGGRSEGDWRRFSTPSC